MGFDLALNHHYWLSNYNLNWNFLKFILMYHDSFEVDENFKISIFKAKIILTVSLSIAFIPFLLECNLTPSVSQLQIPKCGWEKLEWICQSTSLSYCNFFQIASVWQRISGKPRQATMFFRSLLSYEKNSGWLASLHNGPQLRLIILNWIYVVVVTLVTVLFPNCSRNGQKFPSGLRSI